MKIAEQIWSDFISSPTLMVILALIYICSTIGKFMTEQEIARREGTLPPKTVPQELVIFMFVGWILFIVALFINWKVALTFRVLIFLIETTPIIGIIGIIPRAIIMVCIEAIFARRR